MARKAALPARQASTIPATSDGRNPVSTKSCGVPRPRPFLMRAVQPLYETMRARAEQQTCGWLVASCKTEKLESRSADSTSRRARRSSGRSSCRSAVRQRHGSRTHAASRKEFRRCRETAGFGISTRKRGVTLSPAWRLCVTVAWKEFIEFGDASDRFPRAGSPGASGGRGRKHLKIRPPAAGCRRTWNRPGERIWPPTSTLWWGPRPRRTGSVWSTPGGSRSGSWSLRSLDYRRHRPRSSRPPPIRLSSN